MAMADLHRVFGKPQATERIPMNDGSERLRQSWPQHGLEILLDRGSSAAMCLTIYSSVGDIARSFTIEGRPCATSETTFRKMLPEAEKGIGHSYSFNLGKWRLYADF